jgi:hypothetical protein
MAFPFTPSSNSHPIIEPGDPPPTGRSALTNGSKPGGETIRRHPGGFGSLALPDLPSLEVPTVILVFGSISYDNSDRIALIGEQSNQFHHQMFADDGTLQTTVPPII